jgi:hypothetical protein
VIEVRYRSFAALRMTIALELAPTGYIMIISKMRFCMRVYCGYSINFESMIVKFEESSPGIWREDLYQV